jgi:large subunit ribosomal protein L15
MKLHDLHPAPGAHQPPRRVGRGHGSGRGKTAGRGTKGQKARAGGGIQPWFEGGQTPLHIRTPKLHGFKNRFRAEYAPVNLAKLAEAAEGTLVTPDVLVHGGLLRNKKLPLKILGYGEAPKGVTVHAHAFSRAAVAKLEAAGSTAQRITWPEGLPVEDMEGDGEDAAEHPADDAAEHPADDAAEHPVEEPAGQLPAGDGEEPPEDAAEQESES